MLLKFNRGKMWLLVLFSLVVMVEVLFVLTCDIDKIMDFMYLMILLIHFIGFIYVKRWCYC